MVGLTYAVFTDWAEEDVYPIDIIRTHLGSDGTAKGEVGVTVVIGGEENQPPAREERGGPLGGQPEDGHHLGDGHHELRVLREYHRRPHLLVGGGASQQRGQHHRQHHLGPSEKQTVKYRHTTKIKIKYFAKSLTCGLKLTHPLV